MWDAGCGLGVRGSVSDPAARLGPCMPSSTRAGGAASTSSRGWRSPEATSRRCVAGSEPACSPGSDDFTSSMSGPSAVNSSLPSSVDYRSVARWSCQARDAGRRRRAKGCARADPDRSPHRRRSPRHRKPPWARPRRPSRHRGHAQATRSTPRPALRAPPALRGARSVAPRCVRLGRGRWPGLAEATRSDRRPSHSSRAVTRKTRPLLVRGGTGFTSLRYCGGLHQRWQVPAAVATIFGSVPDDRRRASPGDRLRRPRNSGSVAVPDVRSPR